MIGEFLFIALTMYMLWLFTHVKKQLPNERATNDKQD